MNNSFPPSWHGSVGNSSGYWSTDALPPHQPDQSNPNPLLYAAHRNPNSSNFVAQPGAMMFPLYLPAAAPSVMMMTAPSSSTTTNHSSSSSASSAGMNSAIPAMISAFSHTSPFSVGYPGVAVSPMMLCATTTTTTPWTQQPPQSPPFFVQSPSGEPMLVAFSPPAPPPASAAASATLAGNRHPSGVSSTSGDGPFVVLPHQHPPLPPSLAFPLAPPPPALPPASGPTHATDYAHSHLQHHRPLRHEGAHVQPAQQPSQAFPQHPQQHLQQQHLQQQQQQQQRQSRDVLRVGQTLTGYVKRYNPGHGFGFIKASNGVDIFVHQAQSHCLLTVGLRVRFEVAESADQVQAINVVALDTPPPPLSTPQKSSPLPSVTHSVAPTGNAAVPSRAVPPLATSGAREVDGTRVEPVVSSRASNETPSS